MWIFLPHTSKIVASLQLVESPVRVSAIHVLSIREPTFHAPSENSRFLPFPRVSFKRPDERSSLRILVTCLFVLRLQEIVLPAGESRFILVGSLAAQVQVERIRFQ
jgi:hypothetical protein